MIALMGLSKKQMEMLMKRLDDGKNHSEEYYGQYLVRNEGKGDL